MNSRELGVLGEGLACEYLVEKGLKILGKNYRIKFGEIDIIAKKRFSLRNLFRKNPSINSGQAIHFVEVKTIVASDGFYPEDRVDYKKQKKLRQLAEVWLRNNKFKQNHPCQIDVIGVTISNNLRDFKIEYFENVVSG